MKRNLIAIILLLAFFKTIAQDHFVEAQVDSDIVKLPLKIGIRAPYFSATCIDGKKIKLGDFKGKYVILDFWGSWCKACINYFPLLKQNYESKYKDIIEIIGVDCHDSEDSWRKAVKKFDLPWLQIRNVEAIDILEKKYDVWAFPTLILIGKDGKVLLYDVGGFAGPMDLIDNLESKN